MIGSFKIRRDDDQSILDLSSAVHTVVGRLCKKPFIRLSRRILSGQYRVRKPDLPFQSERRQWDFGEAGNFRSLMDFCSGETRSGRLHGVRRFWIE